MTEFPEGSSKRRLVEALLDPSARLLVADAGGPSATIRLAHEALISEWQRARDYVAQNADSLRVRRTLEDRYSRWLNFAKDREAASKRRLAPTIALRTRLRPEHGLLTDIDLTDAQRLLRDFRSEVAPELVDFIQRSLDHDRRRRLRWLRVVSAVAIVFWMLSAFAGAEWWNARKQRDAARAQAETADRTTRFMVSLFDAANPETNRGVEMTVRQALDRGARTIDSDLEREPNVRAELLTAMGQAYSGLGSYAPAESLLSRARRDQSTTEVPIESRVRTLVASGNTQYLAGNYDQAITFQRAAVDLSRRGLHASAVVRSEALDGLADALVAQGIYPEAVQLCLEALAEDRKREPPDMAVLSHTLNSLGTAYLFSGDLTAAEGPYREALKIRQQEFTSDHALTAESMGNLGSVLYQMGRFAEAAEVWEQALPIYRQVYRDDHPELAALLNDLGRSHLMAGRVDDAEPLLRQSLSMTEKFEGEDHDDLVAPLNSLAMIDVYRGRFDAARSELQRAEAIARKRAHNDLLDQVLLNEADLALTAGDSTRASALLIESRKLLEAAHPNNDTNAWRYAIWASVNAALVASMGDPTQAQRMMAAAQNVIRQRYGEKGLYTVLAQRRAQLIDSKISKHSG
jgi:tetratricopeptide (TPR) repeat protein